MSDVLAEYLERRAEGDTRTTGKLAIACAETVHKRAPEDAMNWADSHDFFEDDDSHDLFEDGDELPGNSPRF
jgi:hypothetical protein